MSSRYATNPVYQYFVELSSSGGDSGSASSSSARHFRCIVAVQKPGQPDAYCDATVAFHSVTSLRQHLQARHKSIAATLQEASQTVGVKRPNPIQAMFGRSAGAAAVASPAPAAASMLKETDCESVDMTEDGAVSSIADSALASPRPLKRAHSVTSSLSGSSARSVWMQDKMSMFIDAPQDPLNCILMMMLMNNMPLSAIDNPYTKQAFQRVAKTGYQLSASRNTMRKMLIQKHRAMKDELIVLLKQQKCAVSFVLDGWTNVVHSKVTNVLLVCRGKAYYWCSITNRSERNTAKYLSAALTPVIQSIENVGIPVVSYVADNEEVMSAAHRMLVTEFEALIRIPCAAHTIQLIVKKLLAQPPFTGVLKEYITMLNLFQSQKELRQSLDRVQPDTNKARNIIRPCETRWSYTLYSIDRSILLKNYLGEALKSSGLEPSSHFWGQLADIATVLRPFAAATDVVQSDKAVLVDVALQFFLLRKHADQIRGNTPELSALILECIDKEWNSNHVNVDVTAACALLSNHAENEKMFTPLELMRAQAFIADWGVKYLSHYQLFQVTEDLRTKLDGQLIDFLGCQNAFGLVKFHDRLKHKGAVASWTSMLSGTRELAHVAVALLSICASEAPVERSFSIQDLVHSKVRNRSGDDMVEAQMFIRFNSPLLHSDIVPTLPKSAAPCEMLPYESSDASESSAPIALNYLLADDPPEILADAMGAMSDSGAGAADAAEEEAPEVNDLESPSEPEEEKESAVASARGCAAASTVRVATEDEEDGCLRLFIATYNVKPNSKGKVLIAGDLENALSTSVEQYVPKIRSQLKDLKARLTALCKSL